MKILIICDTHRKHENLLKVLERECPVDLLIHLGDAEGDEDYIAEQAGCPVEVVAGNNDFFSSAVKLDNGTKTLEEMKKEPYLYVVSFSDFSMDSLSGYFGGEIRLAYLFDGEKVTPVTGGSVSGNLLELQKDMAFSTERYKDKDYDGPLAVEFHGVAVAGK